VRPFRSVKLVTLLWLLSASVLLAAAAAASTGASSALTAKTWQLTSLAGKKPLAATSITAEFSAAGNVAGSSGCNHYSAAYTVAGSAITISKLIAATMMACPTRVMAQEAAYLKALTSAKSYSIKGSALTLSGPGGRVLAAYAAQSQSLTGTSWSVLSYNNGKQAVVSVLAGTKLTADFGKDGNLVGFAGCNDYNAPFKATSPKISLGQLASTRKYCASPAGLMDQESEFLTALATVATYKISGPTLELRTAKGAIAVDMTRR